MYSLLNIIFTDVAAAVRESEFKTIDSDGGGCAYGKRIGAGGAGPREIITDAGDGDGDEGNCAVSIDVHHAIIVVALGFLNDGADAGHVVTSRTGSGLDGNEVGINVLTGTRCRVTGLDDGNLIRVRHDTETAGVHGKD